MADSTKSWPIILDEASFSYLVELSRNLSKVEGLVKKLVKGEYQQYDDKNYKSGQNSQNYTSVENISWDNYRNAKAESEDDKWSDWYPTSDGDASSEKNNNPKSEWTIRWDDDWDAEPDWSSVESKNETAINWDTPKVSQWDKAHWESEWRKSDSKESNQEKIDWDSPKLSDW
ncbi:uncharacterized protein LOC107367629 [Tetranychus urticae]|uniref:Uncharacterized protein n=1 Tax=Tetranychus urticae TaxID=32264 RepID=T1KVS5_TETUR|nr:uncharacterized protein LOC107367629 [Tetranychus urticae]XP_015790840.1 uncharacterized protein LOC107367629 [Tetranychus urticae]XP_015790841.1 uncharacterized protein LOC107367629 [Tetranychus urticae]